MQVAYPTHGLTARQWVGERFRGKGWWRIPYQPLLKFILFIFHILERRQEKRPALF